MERVWEDVKYQIAWELFQNLSHLSDRICSIIQTYTPHTLQSLTYYPYIQQFFEPTPRETL